MTTPEGLAKDLQNDRNLTAGVAEALNAAGRRERSFRITLLVMFIVVGLFAFNASRISSDAVDASKANAAALKTAQAQNATAIEQNDQLQRSLDALITDQEAQVEIERIRAERSAAFFAAVLSRSSDPVLQQAARDALAAVEGTDAEPQASSSPSRRQSQPSPAPGPRATPSPSRAPASPRPSESPTAAPGPLGGTVSDVCALTRIC